MWFVPFFFFWAVYFEGVEGGRLATTVVEADRDPNK